MLHNHMPSSAFESDVYPRLVEPSCRCYAATVSKQLCYVDLTDVYKGFYKVATNAHIHAAKQKAVET